MAMTSNDFYAALEQAKANQAKARMSRTPFGGNAKLRWPQRSAKGGHAQVAQKKAKQAQDWMAAKLEVAIDKDFWDQAKARVAQAAAKQ